MNTIAPSEVPASLLNAQGTILDPVAIKKSSAAKMRLADKTGNVALRKEAAAEQSFADRLGGRTALLSDELKKQIQEQKEAATKAVEGGATPAPSPVITAEDSPVTSPTAEIKRTRKSKKQVEEESDTPRKPLDSSSIPFQPSKQQVQIAALAAIQTNYALPPEAIILKLDAATKQSIADKTGNLVLKRTAALEQSLADKMAYVSAPGVTTTALRAGRKGFMLDASLFQQPQPQTQSAPTSPVQTIPAAPKVRSQQSSPQQQRQQPRQPQQKKERSYFNKDSFTAPSRADNAMDWRTPSPKASPPTDKYQPPRTSPIPKHRQVKDGADFVVSTSPSLHEPKLDIVDEKREVMVGPSINPLAPAAACM